MTTILRSLYAIIILAALFLCTSCEKFALMNTPAKTPAQSNSKLSQLAEQKFWITLHQGRYNDIPQTLHLLTAAYLENPNDPNLAAYLGFTHIWAISERQRNKTLDPMIVDHAILARKYFADAVALAPQDARFLGFYGDATLVEGKIFADQKQQVKGYFILQQAINAWPQFNYFTAGYPMSILPANSDLFKQALEWQWKTLDLCAQQKIDRNDPDFSPYMRLATQIGPQRACWNSWIAPHNFEGFFLNMGDMLVKSGDVQTAVKIYNNAKLSPDYKNWKYKMILENRILDAKDNIQKFNQDIPLTQMPKQTTMMFNSSFSCMACHQQ